MALYIHYSGKLKYGILLEDLENDLATICEKNQWDYHIFGRSQQNEKKESDEKIRGISIVPGECKAIHLTFDNEGNLYNLRYKLLSENPDNLISDFPEFSQLNPVSAKTLEAGYLGHKNLIQMFKYISEKYFSEFSFKDDSGYWDHMDDHKLANWFGLSDIKLQVLKELVDDAPDSGMDLEEMIHIHSTSRKTQRWLDGDPLYREIYPVCP